MVDLYEKSELAAKIDSHISSQDIKTQIFLHKTIKVPLLKLQPVIATTQKRKVEMSEREAKNDKSYMKKLIK